MPTLWVYVAFDGDRIGREVGRASLADDAEALRQVSQRIEQGNEAWKSWALANGGEVVSLGGDEGRVRIGAEHLGDLPQLRTRYADTVGATVSVGVGARLSEADRALLAAKLRGGDRITLYQPEIEDELARVKPKTEAEKIGEAYLGKDDLDSDTSFLFGANADAHGEARRVADRLREPNRGTAHAFLDYVSGKTPERPDIHPDLERHLARFGIVDPKGYAFGEDGRSLHRPIPGRRGTGVEQPRELARYRAMSRGADPGYVKGELQKDEPGAAPPALNTPSAGGGITGPHQAPPAGPGAPAGEASEHSENEALQTQLADAPAPMSPPGNGGPGDDFSAMADAQGQQDQSEADQAQAQQDAQDNAGDLKDQVVKILQTFQDRKEQLEQLAEADPELYESITGLIKVLIAGSKQLFLAGDGGQPEGGKDKKESKESDTKKSERAYKLEGDALIEVDPKTGKSLGKGPVNPDALKTERGDCNHFFGKAKACLRCGVHRDMEKASLDPGKTGRHQVVLPPGSQKDAGPNATRDVGKLKVVDAEGKQKWRSVRAGLVMDPSGQPTSSRNPGG